ncbi:MAG: sensor histidine kinase [Acidiferrobacterales bacterium]
MEKLITDCLDFSRGITVGAQEPIVLPSFLADLCTGLSRGSPVVRDSGTARMVHANRSALTRVIRNLVENAQRYGNGSPVEINLSGHEEAVYIEILDNGPGIPEDEREHVFQPFVRLETSRNPATGGSGLGLAVVREICRAHGWGITLHNRHGAGLRARLCLQTGG